MTNDCPICLEHPIQVYGPCNHGFCREDVERLLLTTPNSPAFHPPRNEEGLFSLTVPTVHSCPLCRRRLSLSELKCSLTNELAYPSDDWSQVLMENLGNHAQHDASEEDADELVFVNTSPLGGVGFGSFHFGRNSSYFNIEKVEQRSAAGRLPLTITYFHAASCTLHAVIRFDDSDNNSRCGLPLQFSHWNIYLSFNRDYTFVRNGAIEKVRLEQDIAKAYPLDGEWKQQDGGVFTVEAFRFRDVDTDLLHFLRVRKGFIGMIQAMSVEIVYRADWNWDEFPHGPEVGQELVWRATSATGPRQIVWIRLSRSEVSPQNEINLLGGTSERHYVRLQGPAAALSVSDICYNKESLYGNIFCQGFKVGLASYHFESADNIYISYQHAATSRWPPLDNGMPVPSRVHFCNIYVDGFTFRGSICWLDDYGTSWQRQDRWDYEMVFDEEFTCIVSGTVTSWSNGVPHEMSRYGEILNYVNAGLYEYFKSSIPTTDENNETTDNYHVGSRQLRQRLQAQGASVRTVAMVHSVYTAACSNADNPVST